MRAIKRAKEFGFSVTSNTQINQLTKDRLHETADLWFHTLVMLSYLDLHPEQVLEELAKRFNISGIAEKASR